MKIANSLLFVAFVFGAATSLPAQDHQSVASPNLFAVSGITVPSGVNLGVARVSGTLELDPTDAAKSALDFSIASAGGKLMSFKSKRASVRADGKLEVTGHLTVIRITRDVRLTPGEDYYGAVYNEPVPQKVTREVTLVLPGVNAVGQKAEITAEANISRENFPELFAAISDPNWPVVAEKSCHMPTVGEDYAGAACTGTTLVEPVCSAAALGIGEDYHGLQCAAPAGNQMTILLQLHPTREDHGAQIAAK